MSYNHHQLINCSVHDDRFYVFPRLSLYSYYNLFIITSYTFHLYLSFHDKDWILIWWWRKRLNFHHLLLKLIYNSLVNNGAGISTENFRISNSWIWRTLSIDNLGDEMADNYVLLMANLKWRTFLNSPPMKKAFFREKKSFLIAELWFVFRRRGNRQYFSPMEVSLMWS